MRKERLEQFNRQNILCAAKAFFLKKGVDKTSMDDIAKGSDTSKSTLYAYFKSKDDIYYSIAREYMQLLYNAIADCVTKGGGARTVFDGICTVLVDFERRYPMCFDYILGKIDCEPEDFERLPVLLDIYDMGEDINRLIVEFFTQAIRSGDFPADTQALPAVFVLWSSLCAIISMSSNKERYIKTHMKLSREEFLRFGFDRLYLTLIR